MRRRNPPKCMRCFIAAWPDESTRLALTALSEDVRRRVEHRRATSIDDLHLTLAFIGELADDDAFTLAEAITKLHFEPFDWRFDTLGFFQQAGVMWVGIESGSEAARPLLNLTDRLRRLLNQMNIDYDRRPLAPHVTLLRGVQRFDLEHVAPIAWRISSIALYRSGGGAGSRYQRVERD